MRRGGRGQSRTKSKETILCMACASVLLRSSSCRTPWLLSKEMQTVFEKLKCLIYQFSKTLTAACMYIRTYSRTKQTRPIGKTHTVTSNT